MKLYNKEFAEINYGREVTNGVFASGKLLYEKPKSIIQQH